MDRPSCTGEMLALFDRWSDSEGRMWGCYHTCTLDNGIYDHSSSLNYCKVMAHNELTQINDSDPSSLFQFSLVKNRARRSLSLGCS